MDTFILKNPALKKSILTSNIVLFLLKLNKNKNDSISTGFFSEVKHKDVDSNVKIN